MSREGVVQFLELSQSIVIFLQTRADKLDLDLFSATDFKLVMSLESETNKNLLLDCRLR